MNVAIIRSHMRPRVCQKGTINTIAREYRQAFDKIELVLSTADPKEREYIDYCKEHFPFIDIHIPSVKNLCEKNNYIYGLYRDHIGANIVLMDDTISHFICLDKEDEKPRRLKPEELKLWLEKTRLFCVKSGFAHWGVCPVPGTGYLMKHKKGIHLTKGMPRCIFQFSGWVIIPNINLNLLQSEITYAEDSERDCQFKMIYGGAVRLEQVRLVETEKMATDDDSGLHAKSDLNKTDGESILQARAREQTKGANLLVQKYPLLVSIKKKSSTKSLIKGLEHSDIRGSNRLRSLFGIPAEQLRIINDKLSKKLRG